MCTFLSTTLIKDDLSPREIQLAIAVEAKCLQLSNEKMALAEHRSKVGYFESRISVDFTHFFLFFLTSGSNLIN